MLSLELTDFMIQLKEGSIANVGAPTKAATAKLFAVESANARAFGDNRVKLAFEDAEGNEVEIALFPDEVESIEANLAEIRESGTVDGMDSDD